MNSHREKENLRGKKKQHKKNPTLLQMFNSQSTGNQVNQAQKIWGWTGGQGHILGLFCQLSSQST